MLRLLLASPAPLVLAGLLYLAQCWAYWQAGQRGMALTLLAYALANVGLVVAWYGK